ASRLAVRGGAAARIREPGADDQDGAAADRSRARAAVVQPDRAHLAVLRGHLRDLSLASRADAEADQGRGLRMGDWVLHQPDVARRSGARAARDQVVVRRVEPHPDRVLPFEVRAGITQWSSATLPRSESLVRIP